MLLFRSGQADSYNNLQNPTPFVVFHPFNQLACISAICPNQKIVSFIYSDKQLIQEICSGLRPKVVSGTPPVFVELMSRCLDANPSNRPTASQLYECLGNWVTAICDEPDQSDLSNQFDEAEEIKFAKLESNLYEKHDELHEQAIYYSRPLDTINSINIESSTFFYGKNIKSNNLIENMTIKKK